MKKTKLVKLNNKKLYYLASPYTAKGIRSKLKRQTLQEQRFREVTLLAIKLIKQQKLDLILPITTSSVLQTLDKTVGHLWEAWKKTDTALVKHSDALLVATMPGWEESTGVQAEIRIAKRNKIPVFYIDSLTLAVWR